MAAGAITLKQEVSGSERFGPVSATRTTAIHAPFLPSPTMRPSPPLFQTVGPVLPSVASASSKSLARLGNSLPQVAREHFPLNSVNFVNFGCDPALPASMVADYGTYEGQLAKYGSPEAVIEAGFRTNPSMDVLTGIAKVRR